MATSSDEARAPSARTLTNPRMPTVMAANPNPYKMARPILSRIEVGARPNGSRLSCGALVKDSFANLRAPPASSAC